MLFEIFVGLGIVIILLVCFNCDSKLMSLYHQLKKISERLDRLEAQGKKK